MRKATLPDTLHELLSTAIEDSEALNRRHYSPHYCFWHRPQPDSRCQVCLGGAILARRLGFHSRSHTIFNVLPSRQQDKLEALNAMRRGAWSYAYELLYRRKPPLPILRSLLALPCPDRSDFDGWLQFNIHIRSMRRILPKLREIENLDQAGSPLSAGSRRAESSRPSPSGGAP